MPSPRPRSMSVIAIFHQLIKQPLQFSTMTQFSDWRSGYKSWFLCHMAFSPLWLVDYGGRGQTKNGASSDSRWGTYSPFSWLGTTCFR
jgi:hypothetical protein